ncbi:hypothetical protein SAMN04488511_11324 [Pedobacter suwonensis]|uniref:Uncharacterized protein n=1 Tax=Pedobacter suwonensis TaxID=332999 RepID=A0A1I0TQU3_9SPHI|nr:hypothetical protein [Pedobacter suwonensis]SFA54127.1 hypothetical protein SAMN04488511_11324 [Pedobacter suwonensis]
MKQQTNKIKVKTIFTFGQKKGKDGLSTDVTTLTTSLTVTGWR